MAKFRVNQKVQRKADGKNGIVRFREVKSTGKYTQVKYLVDFGEGMEKWQILERKDLTPILYGCESPYIFRYYEVGDGRSITLAARIDKEKFWSSPDVYNDCVFFDLPVISKKLSIGYSIYNGEDEFNIKLGRKMAVHRLKTKPFSTMTSSTRGEFQGETLESILDAKANYIINHIDKFAHKG